NNELRMGFRTAGQVAFGPGNIRNIEVPALRHGRSANTLAHWDLRVFGFGPDVRAEDQRLSLQDVNPDPVEAGGEGRHVAHGRPQRSRGIVPDRIGGFVSLLPGGLLLRVFHGRGLYLTMTHRAMAG